LAGGLIAGIVTITHFTTKYVHDNILFLHLN
jgi:hypothetical protein